MDWYIVNDSLIQARGRGFTFSVWKMTQGGYLVKKDSYTNGRDQAVVRTEREGISLAERWNADRA